ncbi:MAG: hypothetical protein C4539_18915, partial [Ignavibacteriales bacterium]
MTTGKGTGYMKVLISILLITCWLYSDSFAQGINLIGPPGNSPMSVVINPINPEKILALCYDGNLFISNDGGISTLSVGQILGIGKLSINPQNPDIIFGGNKQSTDGGYTWSTLSISGVQFIFNPFNPVIVYAHDGFSIWKTFDNGTNWTNIQSFSSWVNSISISASDTNIIYSTNNDGIYRSTDAGNSWEKRTDYYPTETWFLNTNIKVNPLNPESVFLTNSFGLYKSYNAGKTWNFLLTKTYLSDFIINPKDSMEIYVLDSDVYSEEGSVNVFKTTDGGAAFLKINTGLPLEFSPYLNTVDMNLQNTMELYIGIDILGTYKTTNGGESWQQTNLTYTPVEDIYFDPDSAGHFLTSVNYLGILKTTNAGQSWYSMNINPSLYFGNITFDNMNNSIGYVCNTFGYDKTTDKGISWERKHLTDAEGTFWSVAIDPFDSRHLMLGQRHSLGGRLWESTDDGETWKVNIEFNSNVYRQIIFSKSIKGLVFLATEKGIFKRNNYDESWTKIYSRNNCFTLKEDTSIVLFTTSSGRFYISMDLGKSWTNKELKLNQNNPYIYDIAVPEYFGNIVYILLDSAVYKTDDNGNEWFKVTDLPVSLNNGYSFIRFNPFDSSLLLINTYMGIIEIKDSTLVSVASDNHHAIKNDFHLSQNFP